MSSFKDYEDRSRKSFNDLFLDKVKPEKVIWSDLTARHDVIFVLKGVIYITELKERSDRYASYSDMFLEYDKYQSLRNIKSKLNNKRKDKVIKLLYVHTFNTVEKVRYTILDETYTEKDFFTQRHQRSQVLNNGDKIKLIKYLSNGVKTFSKC